MSNDEKTWQWSDAYGDEGGNALLRESDGNGAVLLEAACSTEEIPPRVRALTEAAPEMEAILRRLAEDDGKKYHFKPNVAEDARVLLARIDERSKGG